MKPRVLIAGVVAIFAIQSAPLQAQGPQYVVTDLGTLGGSTSFSQGINSSGQVTGGADTSVEGNSAAFLYSNGLMSNLGYLANGTRSFGRDINDSGLVTGFSTTSGNSFGNAFLYSDGSMRKLGGLTDDSLGSGYGINSLGEVVGDDSPNPATHNTFLYSNGNMSAFGAVGTRGRSINDSGQVTGSSIFNNVGTAFLYSNGTMISLGTLGGSLSLGTDINNSGQVTGYSYTPGISDSKAFIYSNGVMKNLGTIGGGENSGLSINNFGQVTGKFHTANDATSLGFLYTDGTMYDLNNLLVGDFRPTISEGNAINDKGQIAATGLVGGQSHALLLNPVKFTNPTPPKITKQPLDIRVALRKKATFSVIASGRPPLSYQWYSSLGPLPDQLIAGAINFTFPLPSVTPDSIRNYYVVVTDGLGRSAKSRLAQLTLANAPKVNLPRISPASRSFAGSLILTMTCVTKGAVIHYTTDGTPPDSSSPVYDPNNPPTLGASAIVQAIATKDGYLQSAALSQRYVWDSGDSAVIDANLGVLDNTRRVVRGDSVGGISKYKLGDGTFTANSTPATVSSPKPTPIYDLEDYFQITVPVQEDVHLSVSDMPSGAPIRLDILDSTRTVIYSASRGQWPLLWEGNTSKNVTPRIYYAKVYVDKATSLYGYRLTVSAGPNWKILTKPGLRAAHHVGLIPPFGVSGILKDHPTWLVIHGRISSPRAEDISTLGGALSSAEQTVPLKQVLSVDWETAAADNASPISLEGAKWIKPVADFIAERLASDSLGLFGDRLSIAAHSWGTHVAQQIGHDLVDILGSGPMKRLIALDPAAEGPGTIPTDDYRNINSPRYFSRVAKYSWAFVSSIFGDPLKAATANDAFLIQDSIYFPIYDNSLRSHGDAIYTFANILADNKNGVGNRFAEKFLLGQMEPGHWKANQYDFSGKARPAFPVSFSNTRFDGLYPYEGVLSIDLFRYANGLLPNP
jgi:probable HAF family extracellular repeat protein